MTNGRNIFARMATVAVMVFCVSVLMRLFSEAPPERDAAEITAQQSDPVEAMARAWKQTVDFAPAYAALNPYADTAQDDTALAFDPSDDYWGLPRTPGHETVAAYCSACHSLQIVMAQRQPREGWDYLLTWMVEKQGMAPPPEEAREEIIDYLVSEFGS